MADYLLQAAGADIPDPVRVPGRHHERHRPVAAGRGRWRRSLFTEHKVKVFLYNQQVTDSLTESFISLAQANGIPVVGVYETMPTPGYDYQSWMLAEVNALQQGRDQQDLDREAVMSARRCRLPRPLSCSGWTGSASGSPAARSCATSASPSGRASSPA